MRTGGDIIAAIKRQAPGRDGPIGVWGSVCKRLEIDRSNGNRDLILYANTDDIDLEDEVVIPDGAAADSYFFRNRKVFLDHSYEYASLVGALRSHALIDRPDGGKAWRVRIHVRTSPLGDDILTAADEVGIGTSIGFRALDFGPPTDDERKRYTKGTRGPHGIVRRWEWLEQSLTAMPCNVACQSLTATAIDATRAAALDRLVTGGLIRRESAYLLGMPDRKPAERKMRRVLLPCGLVRARA